MSSIPRLWPQAALVLAALAVLAGGWLRFGSGYFYREQLELLALISLMGASFLVGLLLILIRRGRDRRRPALASVTFGAALVVLLLFTYESPTAHRARNRAYLERLARMVLAYQSKHGHAPETFTEALHESGMVLPNRGDADGHPLTYFKLGEDRFYLRSGGPPRVLVYSEGGQISAAEFPSGRASQPAPRP